jgi:hypothetical protein
MHVSGAIGILFENKAKSTEFSYKKYIYIYIYIINVMAINEHIII